MTGARVKVGFALGAALAGMLAAAVRLTGLDDGATATADEAARPAASRVEPAVVSPGAADAAPAPIPATAAERWRAKPAGPHAVTARVVNRAAVRKAPDASADAAACTAGPPSAPGRRAGAPEPAESPAACAPEPRAEPVEIDWNAPTQAR